VGPVPEGLPSDILVTRRLSILIFHDSRDGFRTLAANWHGASTSGPMYTNIFTDRSNGPRSPPLGKRVVAPGSHRMGFVPPARAECLRADGIDQAAPPYLRRALEFDDLVESLPPAGPHDWLAVHAEGEERWAGVARSRLPLAR
jgi:hypothetical protein